MNLSVEWVDILTRHGWTSVHWSTIGDSRAKDTEIMEWARTNHHCVFTHDLDFGTMLALSHASGPSVLQIRGQNVLPEDIETMVVSALRQHTESMITGALVAVDAKKSRCRVLPL